MESLAREDPSCFLGLRPGEMLGCIHVPEGPDGCGTSKACARCGAVLAILASQGSREPVAGECLMSMAHEGVWESREFHARATPLRVGNHRLTVLTLRDISAEKRRELLERVFLHDLMNTLQGLRGWTEILQGTLSDPTRAAERILDLSDRLTQEVVAQRYLLQAEQGRLIPEMVSVPPDQILEGLAQILLQHTCSRNREVVIERNPGAQLIQTDPGILSRVVLNMTVNALEATEEGGRVRVWFGDLNGSRGFFVHNSGHIPSGIAARMFHRSFSTKGDPARGLGTYSMKLLGESVLKGRVGFTSTPEAGTHFFMLQPRST